MSQTVPLIAATWLATCLALSGCADDEPPRILSVVFPPSTSDQMGPYSVEAVVEDDCCLRSVELLMVEDALAEPDRLLMAPLGEGHHGVSFGGFPAPTSVLLAVEASDEHGNQARYPTPGLQAETGCEPGPDQTCWVRFEVYE